MFSEILKINPRLDNSDLNKMERTLTQRFGRVAKKFGQGMKGALLGGGLAGVALGIVEKVLNPLKEVQESIDRIMNQGDDLVTNAAQFGTTAGKLMELGLIAKSTGLDQDQLYMLMSKFQNSVAEAVADPAKDSAVKNFVNIKDTADAFFQFIQSLNALGKTDKNAQIRVQQEVFGEKQILKMADFLGTDMRDQLQKLRLAPAAYYDAAAQKAGAYNGLAGIFTARREGDDFIQKSGALNQGMLSGRDQQLRNELQRENERIRNYHALLAVSETSAKALAEIEKNGLTLLREGVVIMRGISNDFKKSSAGRFMRGIMGIGE